MYGKCRSLLDARRVFDAIEIDRHDVVSWTALIMACVENNEENLALDLFDSMKASRVDPNSRTFAAALKACKGLAAIEDPRPSSEARFVKSRSLRRGAAIHNEAADRGFDTGVFVVNSLLEMYAACGSMIDARRVFERSSSADRDLASWNSIIAGYVDNGDDDLALELFDVMEKQDRIRPSSVTFSAALKACGNIAVRAAGRRIDGKIIKLDPLEKAFEIHSRLDSIGSVFDSIDYATNTLIDVYMKCGSVIDARRVFDRVISRDIVSWNIVMLGYGENGEEEIALELLQAMLDDDRRDDRRRDHRRCCKPDSRSFCAAIRACGSLAEQEHGQEVAGKIVKVESLKKARNLHSDALRFSVGTEAFVASSLVDLFGKCGSMAESRRVFDKMPVHDAVTRTALMMGYADSGDGDLAMEIYSGTGPDRDAPHAFVALLKCARVLDSGKIIHGQICRAGLESDPVLEATLIDVYGKWGSMEDAQRIFDARIFGPQRICEYSNARDGLVSWNALIGGYARRGDTESVMKLFFGMLDQGLEPDPVTFLGILTACSHAGEAETGRSFFESMRIRHGIQPGLSHYHAMVDVLGRVNRVDEAVDLVKSMPFKANGVTWRTVLSACRKWNKSTTGKLAFDAVLETDRSDSAAYVLMANIYNEVGS